MVRFLPILTEIRPIWLTTGQNPDSSPINLTDESIPSEGEHVLEVVRVRPADHAQELPQDGDGATDLQVARAQQLAVEVGVLCIMKSYVQDSIEVFVKCSVV